MSKDENKSHSLQCLKNSTKLTTVRFILECFTINSVSDPADHLAAIVQRFLFIFCLANNAVFWRVKRTCQGHMRIISTMDEMGDISREACGHNGGPAVKGHIGQAAYGRRCHVIDETFGFFSLSQRALSFFSSTLPLTIRTLSSLFCINA